MKKYLLILITTLSFGQASNQMVTFLQAQNLNFALNSGQSHVNSTQCMTKADALAKYTLNASGMSAYANNQLVPRSTWVNGVAYFTFIMETGQVEGQSATCQNHGNGVTMYSGQSNITMPMTFYNNEALTMPFPAGGGTYYYAANNQLLTINNSGQVTAISSCQGDVTPPSVPSSVAVFYDSGYNFFLSWNASTDNVGVIGYEIFDNDQYIATVGPDNSFYLDNVCSGNHSYKIRAFDAAGNYSARSAVSNTITSSNPTPCN